MSNYTKNEIKVIPFGVDTDMFRKYGEKEKGAVRFGIVKSLERQYNIEFAIKAFEAVAKRLPDRDFELLIAGEGTLKDELVALCSELNISDCVKFVGRIPFGNLPEFYNKLDVFLNFSKMESFGVSVLEASACELPVIAVNAQGLSETVDDDGGFLLDSFDLNDAAEKMSALAFDEILRKEMGERGRAFVKRNYEWSDCVDKLLEEYEKIISSKQDILK